MEKRFNETKDIDLAPDTRKHNAITEGLASVGDISHNEAKVARKTLHSMRTRYFSGENPIAMSTRYICTHVMLCEARVGNTNDSFWRVEKLYRQLENDYRDLNSDILKPDAASALPLFQVAVGVKRNSIVLERAFEVFDELWARYIETGDPFYRPLEKMYTYLLTSFAKLGPSKAKDFSSRLDKLIESMKKDYSVPTASIRRAGKFHPLLSLD